MAKNYFGTLITVSDLERYVLMHTITDSAKVVVTKLIECSLML